MKFALGLIFSVLFILPWSHALEHDIGAWNMSVITAPLESSRTWRLYMEGQFRYADDSGRFYETLLRPMLDYNLNSKHMISIGYLSLLKDSEKSVEDRFFIQTLSSQAAFDLSWLLRLRFEERHIHSNNKNSYRLRALLRGQSAKPIGANFYPFVANEVFINLNKTAVTSTGWAQNRLQVGLQNRSFKSLLVEVGYLGAYVDNTAIANLFLHNLFLNLIYNF